MPKYRLITRSDFDGLVCAILFKELDMIDQILFVHPKDMQDGMVDVSPNDITTNLPYVPGVFLAFDHHLSETLRISGHPANHIIDPNAPSAARVVYEYYGGKKRFTKVTDELMDAVDKSDSGHFTQQEVLYPKKWGLLNFIMDPRTGLGRFKNFRVSNYDLMMTMIDFCRIHPINEILEHPDVADRIELYFEQEEKFKDQIRRCSTIYQNLVVLDLLDESIIYAGNRFMIYALFPTINISIHALHGKNNSNTVFAVGKSIFNRTSNTDIGKLMLKYGGGGHLNAGTCQVDNDKAGAILAELIDQINADG
jgi:nanoRNase/pAp phosphatase (c-di-AMP/oligoRNAs hydrolase)